MKKRIYFLIMLYCCGAITFAQVVSTFATVLAPEGLALDASGNIYVPNSAKFYIHKISPTGVVSIFAGNGTQGIIDGPSLSASFSFPKYVAVDASGNVYVSESARIRKIASGTVSTVSTLAGAAGIAGNVDGIGTFARFNTPLGIVVDALGNLYVADYGNNNIRKITPAGVVSTFAGSGVKGSANGTGILASFDGPIGIGIDASGNLYVSEYANNIIRKITPAGVVSNFAGSGAIGSADGVGTLASFSRPKGIAVDITGNVYVGDTYSYKIRKITPAGVVSTLAGSGIKGSVDGIGASASFDSPNGVAVDASGNVYVADTGNSRIRKITGIPLGSTNFEIVSKLNIYPNPVTSLLKIQTPNNTTLDKVCIIDLTGKKVLEQTQNTTQIDVARLAKGMYIIEVFSGEEKFSSKFLKE